MITEKMSSGPEKGGRKGCWEGFIRFVVSRYLYLGGYRRGEEEKGHREVVIRKACSRQGMVKYREIPFDHFRSRKGNVSRDPSEGYM